MTSKADYLKKYFSEGTSDKKKKKRLKKKANFAVHDDDVDWRSLTPVHRDGNHSDVEEHDPDEAPLVAAFKDDSVRKWQPVSNTGTTSNDKSDDCSSPRRTLAERKQICPQRKKRMDSPDLSPPRRKEYGDVPARWEDDLSPPRQGRSSSSDLSPPRGDRQGGENISLLQRRQQSRGREKRRRPRSPGVILSSKSNKRQRQEFVSDKILDDSKGQVRHDLSTDDDSVATALGSYDSPDVRHGEDSDNSPLRSRRNTLQIDTSYLRSQTPPPILLSKDSRDKMVRMASGKKAGLQNAKVLKEENESARKQEEAYYQSLDSTVLGKDAETVYRDKGRKIDPKLENKQEERTIDEENEKFMLWGRG